MSRIRGLYVAQIILAVDKERNESTLLPEKIKEIFDGLEEAIKDGLTGAMKSELGQGNFTTVEVATQFSDVYEVDKET